MAHRSSDANKSFLRTRGRYLLWYGQHLKAGQAAWSDLADTPESPP